MPEGGRSLARMSLNQKRRGPALIQYHRDTGVELFGKTKAYKWNLGDWYSAAESESNSIKLFRLRGEISSLAGVLAIILTAPCTGQAPDRISVSETLFLHTLKELVAKRGSTDKYAPAGYHQGKEHSRRGSPCRCRVEHCVSGIDPLEEDKDCSEDDQLAARAVTLPSVRSRSVFIASSFLLMRASIGDTSLLSSSARGIRRMLSMVRAFSGAVPSQNKTRGYITVDRHDECHTNQGGRNTHLARQREL
jgi:hypothetical protein